MKITLNEVKAMNKIAGTQMTKEQEIKFIKSRLQELEFGTQAAFDTYSKNHDLRPDTKVKVAGKDTTAGQASKNSSNPGMLKKLGAKLFGGGDKPKDSSNTSDKKPATFDDTVKDETNFEKKYNGLKAQYDAIDNEKSAAIMQIDKEMEDAGITWFDDRSEPYSKKRNDISSTANKKLSSIRGEMDKAEPSRMNFGDNSKKDVTNWFKDNNISYELKKDQIQFDANDFPLNDKEKMKSFKDLAGKVMDTDQIMGSDQDYDSIVHINKNQIKK